MNTVPLHPFCGKKDSFRYGHFLSQPFSRGRFTYATDGRILVRVPRCKEIPLVQRNAPKAHRNTAKGADELFDKFPKRGFIEIEIPHKKAVPKNNYGQHVVQIGASNFNMIFLLAMKRLPNLKVKPPRIPQEAMQFTFDGGVGKVMPTLANARFTIKIKK